MRWKAKSCVTHTSPAMKSVLLIVFAALAALSAVAWVTKPEPLAKGLLPLTRVTDSHPRRSIELAGFNRANPGLFLTLDPGNAGTDKIIVQSSSGVGPDLFDVYGGDQLQSFVESGIAMDVTEEARRLGFSAEENVWPAARGEVTYQGRQYSYPANVNVNILVYNKNLFDELGVPYPHEGMTWEELFALGKKFSRADSRDPLYGVASLSWKVFFESLHGEYFSPDGTQLLVSGPKMRRAFELHRRMIFEDRIAPSTVMLGAMAGQGGFGSGAINQFADGRFGMICVGKWALANFRRIREAQLLAGRADGLRLGAVMLPHFDGEPPFYRVMSKSVAVNALGERSEEAVKFLAFLATEEYARIINEGVDALPGNPAFADAGLEAGDPELSEIEMHEKMVAAMAHGYQPGQSPFLLTLDVDRVVSAQISRLEADPGLEIAEALAGAQRELEGLMQRNLNRDPQLAKRYLALTGRKKVQEAAR